MPTLYVIAVPGVECWLLTGALVVVYGVGFSRGLWGERWQGFGCWMLAGVLKGCRGVSRCVGVGDWIWLGDLSGTDSIS